MKNSKVPTALRFILAAVLTASYYSANAQANPFVCNTSFSPLVVRVEGLRELVGDIVITCTGGNSVGSVASPLLSLSGNTASVASGVVAAPGTGTAGTIGAGGAYTALATPTVPAINISVSVTGTRITNRIFSGNLTDALLFIDEPSNPASGASTTNQNACLNTGTTVGTAGV